MIGVLLKPNVAFAEGFEAPNHGRVALVALVLVGTQVAPLAVVRLLVKVTLPLLPLPGSDKLSVNSPALIVVVLVKLVSHAAKFL